MSSDGLNDILKSTKSAAEKISELQQSEAGKNWLAEYEKSSDPWFYVSCGSGWYNHEGSWLTDPDIPYSYLKGYVDRLEKGETIERKLDDIEYLI